MHAAYELYQKNRITCQYNYIEITSNKASRFPMTKLIMVLHAIYQGTYKEHKIIWILIQILPIYTKIKADTLAKE